MTACDHPKRVDGVEFVGANRKGVPIFLPALLSHDFYKAQGFLGIR